ncbi:MAG TPA: hypothetical protein VKG25_01280 [Bryobacteraceae bacterium]|nr:hypothetical protein [Bryobacteraceae bacterium]
MEAVFTSAVNHFAVNPSANGKTLRELLNSDPDEFFRNAVPLLKRQQAEPGPTYVLVLLLSHGLLLRDLLRDDLFKPDELVAIAKQLSKVDPQFGVKLLKSVLPDSEESATAEPADVNMRLRVMDILQSISEGQRILPLMMRLLRDPDARVRSKAALLVGRTTQSARWAEDCLGEGDSRVRANTVESLWDIDSEGVRALLWNALSDPDNRVLGNALLGLYRLGESPVIEHILLMAQDTRDLFRATAAWVMGRTCDSRFQPILVNLLRDGTLVRANAFRALCAINQTKARLARAPAVRLSGWRNPSSHEHDEVQVALSLEGDSAHHKSTQLSGVRPTEFVVYRDSALVGNYEVTEVTRTAPLALAFLLPCSGVEDSAYANYVVALKTTAASRRPADRWLIARYNNAPVRKHASAPSPAVWSGNGPLNLRAAEAPAAPPPAPAPDPLFLSDSRQIDEIIETAVAQSGSQPTAIPTALQCLEAAMRAAQNIKSPQFVLLLPPKNSDEFSLDFLTEAGRAVSALKASFHAVSLSGAPVDPGIQSLCQKSGGVCVRTDAGELAQVLADLSARMIGSYRIRFPAAAGATAAGSIKVQVQSERGCGSLLLDAGER